MTTVLSYESPTPSSFPDAPLLTLAVRLVPPDAVVLSVTGEVDISTSPFLQRVLLSHLRDAPLVTVDLTRTSFIGAAGLSVLLNVREAAAAAGSTLRVVACTTVVLLPLMITGLDREFDIHPILADVPSFPGGGSDG